MKSNLIERYKAILPDEYDEEIGEFLSSIEEALEDLPYEEDFPEDGDRNPQFHWYQIVNLETMGVVKSKGDSYHGKESAFEE